MASEDQANKQIIELEGEVVEILPNALFRVQIDSTGSSKGPIILGHISGKMRTNNIKVLKGDRVIIVVTPYDLERGRITRRMR